MKRDEAISRLQQHEAELKRLGVEHLYMFGSTARGEAKDDSDVDLFFDYEKGKLGLFELMDVKVSSVARPPGIACTRCYGRRSNQRAIWVCKWRGVVATIPLERSSGLPCWYRQPSGSNICCIEVVHRRQRWRGGGDFLRQGGNDRANELIFRELAGNGRSKTVRPTSRRMIYAQNLDRCSLEPIGHDVGCPRNDKFAGARDPSRSAHSGIVWQELLDVLYNEPHGPPGSSRTVFRNIGAQQN
jgi:hypothetical protein